MPPELQPKKVKLTLFFPSLILSLSSAFLFYKYILQISPSVMSDYLMQSFSLSATGLGILVGFYFHTFTLMQIPAGMLIDRYNFGIVTPLAILICGIGALLFAHTHSFVIACLGRLLIGLGAAFATVNYMKVASVAFPPQYFGFLSGMFGTACMIGASAAEAPLAYFVNYWGWRETLSVAGFIGVGIALLFFIIMYKGRRAFIPTTSHPTKTVAPIQMGQALKKVLTYKPNWTLLLFNGFSFTPVGVFGGLWGVSFLMRAYHIPRTTAAFTASLVFLSYAAGGPIIGWVSMYIKNRRYLMFAGMIASIVFLGLVIYGSPYLPYWGVNLAIIGLGLSNSVFLLNYGIAKDINPTALTATAIAVINMGDPICSAIAEPLIGRLLDWGWGGAVVDQVHVFSVKDYQFAFSILMIYLILAAACCVFIREKNPDI